MLACGVDLFYIYTAFVSRRRAAPVESRAPSVGNVRMRSNRQDCDQTRAATTELRLSQSKHVLPCRNSRLIPPVLTVPRLQRQTFESKVISYIIPSLSPHMALKVCLFPRRWAVTTAFFAKHSATHRFAARRPISAHQRSGSSSSSRPS